MSLDKIKKAKAGEREDRRRRFTAEMNARAPILRNRAIALPGWENDERSHNHALAVRLRAAGYTEEQIAYVLKG